MDFFLKHSGNPLWFYIQLYSEEKRSYLSKIMTVANAWAIFPVQIFLTLYSAPSSNYCRDPGRKWSPRHLWTPHCMHTHSFYSTGLPFLSSQLLSSRNADSPIPWRSTSFISDKKCPPGSPPGDPSMRTCLPVLPRSNENNSCLIKGRH